MSKWTKLKDSFPKLRPFDAAVEERKKAYAKLTLDELASRITVIKHGKKNLNDELSSINIDEEAATQLMVDTMEALQLKNFTMSDGTNIGLRDVAFPQVKDKEALLEHFLADEQLRKFLSVHHQTLKGLVGEQLTNGLPLPPGVELFFKTSISVRGASASEQEGDSL